MPRSLSLGPGPHEARHCAIMKLKLSQTQFLYHFVIFQVLLNVFNTTPNKMISYWGAEMYLKISERK